MADKTLRISLDLPELPAGPMADLFSAYMQGDQGVQIDEVLEKGEKSPSKRLKDAMYVYYKEAKDPTGEGFDAWYKLAMENIRQQWLDKLN